eukprot:SAG11_NODE_9765_length_882_cov_1.278416_1_plen_86_part_10
MISAYRLGEPKIAVCKKAAGEHAEGEEADAALEAKLGHPTKRASIEQREANLIAGCHPPITRSGWPEMKMQTNSTHLTISMPESRR